MKKKNTFSHVAQDKIRMNLSESHISKQLGEKLQAIRMCLVLEWFDMWDEFFTIRWHIIWKDPSSRRFPREMPQIKATTLDFYGSLVLWNSNIFKWERS